MSDKELIDLFYELRRAQKRYFKTHDNNVLRHCKCLEEKVDAELYVRLQPDLSM